MLGGVISVGELHLGDGDLLGLCRGGGGKSKMWRSDCLEIGRLPWHVLGCGAAEQDV